EVQVRSRNLHQLGLDGVGRLPDETVGQTYLDVLFIARERVKMRRQLDAQHFRNRKGAALAVDVHVNRHDLRIELVAHRSREQGVGSVATGAAVGDIGYRLAL